MKCFSLFTGVGGFEQGFPKHYELVGFSEIDKYASMVLKYRFPNVKNYGDCKKIDWSEVPDFELLTGGSPCQDFSIAGKREGIVGSESRLVWEYVRALQEKKPRYFIWENVKGVLSSRRGFDFGNILTAFSEAGYSLWWQVLNAKDFGVAQNRERIIIVAHPKESFDFSKIEKKEPKKLREILDKNGPFEFLQKDRYTILPKTKWKKQTSGLIFCGYRNMPIRKNGVRPNTEHLSGVHKQPNRIYHIDGTHPTLPSQETSGRFWIYDDKKVRKLMPIEAERLMSWADNWTKYGIDEKGNKVEISDSQRYRQCGNGVASNVVRELCENLL